MAQQNSFQSALTQSELVLALRLLALALAQSVDFSDLNPDPLLDQDRPHRQGRRLRGPLLPLDLHHRLTTLRRPDLQADHSDQSTMTMGQALAQQNSFQSARTPSELVLALRSLALALAQSVDSSDLIPDPLPGQVLPHRQGRRLLGPLLPLDSLPHLTTLLPPDQQPVHSDLVENLPQDLSRIDLHHLNRWSWMRSQCFQQMNQRMQSRLSNQKMIQH